MDAIDRRTILATGALALAGAASALVPKIALMIFPKMLIRIAPCELEDS